MKTDVTSKKPREQAGSICFFVPYFGKLPAWFNLYLKSCEFNPSVNWIFYTNCRAAYAPANTKFVTVALDDFNKLASQKLGFPVKIKNPYKLCDFKPAYGIIFEDYLKNYAFWGHTDVDIIYGDIKKFITKDILENYEIISSSARGPIGHFCLYKNNNRINNLFKNSDEYKNIFSDKRYLGFDEFGWPNNDQLAQKLRLASITSIVKNMAGAGRIKIYLKETCRNGFLLEKKFVLYFNNGKLTDTKNDTEYMYFHFFKLKNFYGSNKETQGKTRNRFYITNYEIFFDKETHPVERTLKRCAQLMTKSFIIIDANIGKFGLYLKKRLPAIYSKIKMHLSGK